MPRVALQAAEHPVPRGVHHVRRAEQFRVLLCRLLNIPYRVVCIVFSALNNAACCFAGC
jgi:hypothetical protein